MNLPTMSTESVRLRDIATEAFHQHVLPAIRTSMPAVERQIVVVITSSVAYGTADQYSDLDVFVIFRREQDFRASAEPLGELIEGLRLDRMYGEVCDKGVRFELESLQRSDLSALYYHPTRANWCRQTEWLLSWFLDAVPIHDPAGVHARLARIAGEWPAATLQERLHDSRIRIARWSATSSRQAEREGLTFAVQRGACRAATAGLELAYLTAGRYAPHPSGGTARLSVTSATTRRHCGCWLRWIASPPS